jgi:hypothetical protein
MQAVILSFLFGAVSTMVLWAAGSAAILRDRTLMQLGRDMSRAEDI